MDTLLVIVALFIIFIEPVIFVVLLFVINKQHPYRLTAANLGIAFGSFCCTGILGLFWLVWLLIKAPKAWPPDPPKDPADPVATP